MVDIPSGRASSDETIRPMNPAGPTMLPMCRSHLDLVMALVELGKGRKREADIRCRIEHARAMPGRQ